MIPNPKEHAERWRQTALVTLETAKRLRDSSDPRSCVSRAYYAAYQAATSVCLAHGDAAHFPLGRNNPSHDQLPDLIANNGDLPANTRRTVRKILRELRHLREDADYRVGITLDDRSVRTALLRVYTLFNRLEIEDGDD
jgi:uncharacterized protein (UPF0332 family)